MYASHLGSVGRADYFVTNGQIEQHIALIRDTKQKSVLDPETRSLAVALVSRSFDKAQDPRTGASVPAVPYHGRYYRGASSWAEARALCTPRDERCEVTAIWNFIVLNLFYTGDVKGKDTYQTLRASLEAGGGDCFPAGTLLLTDDYRLVPIEHVHAGQRIWGHDRWSEVVAVGPRGDRPLWGVRLNNGSWLRLTEEHQVYVLHCPRHANRNKTGPCSCPATEREVVKLAVCELQPNMVLLQPERIPCAPEDALPDAERAWLHGVYLADGWSEACRFAISGKDGHPKQAQKERVRAYCEKLGISTRWDPRYISVNDAALAREMALFGGNAPTKRLPSLALREAHVRALVEGLMADSGANTSSGRTWSSTSYELAVQMRVLQRMLGQRTGWATLIDHGGLGTHPIHRLTVRDPAQTRAPRLLRVKSVEPLHVSGYTWDIQTDDHKVYLPEHDVTVSNCDDFTVALIALLEGVGYTCRARVISLQGKTWDHIYPLVYLPRSRGWLALDATERGKPMGWEFPRPKAVKDFVL